MVSVNKNDILFGFILANVYHPGFLEEFIVNKDSKDSRDLRRRIERAGQVLTVPLVLYSVAPDPAEAQVDSPTPGHRMVELTEGELRGIDARGFPEQVRDRLVDEEANGGALAAFEEAVPLDTRKVRELARNASDEFNRRFRDRIDRLAPSDLGSVMGAFAGGPSLRERVAGGFSFQDAFNLVQGTSRLVKAVTEAEGSLERRFRQP